MVWGRDGFVEPRTVDVHVARLRGKFSAAKLEEPGIETYGAWATASKTSRNTFVTSSLWRRNMGARPSVRTRQRRKQG
jgi:hypothetical protein